MRISDWSSDVCSSDLRTIESARIAIGVRVVLREIFQLADIDLADQRRDILFIFIARLSLGNADLMQARRKNFFACEARAVAVELFECFSAQRVDRARKWGAGTRAEGSGVGSRGVSKRK